MTTTTNAMEPAGVSELLPCPFCGADAELTEQGAGIVRISCSNWKSCGMFPQHKGPTGETRAAWNSRAGLSCIEAGPGEATMRAALAPFAALGKEAEWMAKADDKQAWGFDGVNLTWGDFRRAAAALSPIGGEAVQVDEAKMRAVVCEALLNAFPMADKNADNYAAVAVKALYALANQGGGK